MKSILDLIKSDANINDTFKEGLKMERLPDYGHTVNSGWGFDDCLSAMLTIDEDTPPLNTTWKINGEIYLLTMDKDQLVFVLFRE